MNGNFEVNCRFYAVHSDTVKIPLSKTRAFNQGEMKITKLQLQ